MKRDPTVSVIIPTYNNANTIIQAIDSVLNQSFTDAEIIVVDDGSTDHTKSVLDPYVHSEKIRYIYQENKGCGAARNTGISLSKGEYLAFLDSDDYWDPTKLQKQVSVLNTNPSYILTYTEAITVSGNGKINIPLRNSLSKQRSGYVARFFVFHNIMTLSSVVVRKETVVRAGGFTEVYGYMMFADLDLWLRVAPLGKFYAIAEPLTYYRFREGVTQGTIRKNYKTIAEVFYVNAVTGPTSVKLWYFLGWARARCLFLIAAIPFIRTVKKIGMSGILKEIRRRAWLQVEFLWYPILKLRLRKLHRGIVGISQLLNFIYKRSFGILVLGQIKSEITQFLTIAKEFSPKTVMEIGTANGGNLFLLANITAENGAVISLDLPGGEFGGGYFKRKEQVFLAFPNSSTKMFLLRGDSHNVDSYEKVNEILCNEPIDLLFIDGDHTYEGVKKDFEMYGPLVRSGGMVVFHDIANPPAENYGTKKFWDEIKLKYKYQEIIENPNQLGYGIGIIKV